MVEKFPEDIPPEILEQMFEGKPMQIHSIRAMFVKETAKTGISIEIMKLPFPTVLHRETSEKLALHVKHAIERIPDEIKMEMSRVVEALPEGTNLHIFTIATLLSMDDAGRSLWHTIAEVDPNLASISSIVEAAEWARRMCLNEVCQL